MRIRYDSAADTLHICFRDMPATCRQLAEGICGEFNAQGELASLAIANASKSIDLAGLRPVILESLGLPVAEGCPPSTVVADHIVLDERGVPWIDDTNMKVKEVVIDKVAWQWSAEAIQLQHPGLSLAQIHAALAYYYDHQADIDAEIKRDDEEVEQMRAAQGTDTPIHKKLRVLGLIP